MNCPVCDRSLAPTLSICPSCGAMMFDTVREELQTKITTGPIPRVRIEEPKTAPPPARSEPIAKAAAASVAAPRPRETAAIATAKTSATLVGFQNKNAPLPDWRIELQNAVQQRKGGKPEGSPTGASYPTSGGAALKAEPAPKPAEPQPEPSINDPRVANALRRIEESRKAFLEPAPVRAPKMPARNFEPHRNLEVVASQHVGSFSLHRSASASTAAAVKPALVPPVKRDTNKLPRIAEPEGEVIDEAPIEKVKSAGLIDEFGEIRRIEIKADPEIAEEIEMESETDEIEDLAPFSMRFGAGLFDIIIVGFSTLLLLSPMAFASSDWFATSSMLVVAGACALVMFAYMTSCLGFFGKTLGMRLFSLELVDAVENEYPTLKQAAVNSSVFIMSLAFGGAGFLTMLFNEEKRAAHDLLSGTILVREF